MTASQYKEVLQKEHSDHKLAGLNNIKKPPTFRGLFLLMRYILTHIFFYLEMSIDL